MDLNIEVSAESVSKAVEAAIVNSAIGDKIKKSVVDLLGKSWDNPIDKAIEKVVMDAAVKLVHTHFAEMIEAAVKAKATQQVVEEIVAKFWDRLVRQF